MDGISEHNIVRGNERKRGIEDDEDTTDYSDDSNNAGNAGKYEVCDVVIKVGNKRFKANRKVLSDVSPYFKAMFSNDFIERTKNVIRVHGIDADAFRTILSYARTGGFCVTDDKCQQLLVTADLLQIRRIFYQTAAHMALSVCAANSIGFYCFAKIYCISGLMIKSKRIILKNFEEAIEERELSRLSADDLIIFLSSDFLVISREEAAFNAVMKWYEGNKHRELDMYNILQHVRFPLMEKFHLCDRVLKYPPMKSDRCKQLVLEAISYQNEPSSREQLSSARTRQRIRPFTMDEVIVVGGGQNGKIGSTLVESFDSYGKYGGKYADFPHAIRDHRIVSTNSDVIYLAGGIIGDEFNDSLYKYDSVLNLWKKMTSMPFLRIDFGFAELNGNLYVVGGNGKNGEIFNSIERYRPETNKWKSMPCASARIGLIHTSAVAYDGQLFVLDVVETVARGGCPILTPVMYSFNPKTCRRKELSANFTPRLDAAVICVDHYIYVIGGWNYMCCSRNIVERYDIKNKRWKHMAEMLKYRCSSGVCLLNKKIYIVGGQCGNVYQRSIEYYDPSKNEWDFYKGTLLTGRGKLACGSITRKINP